MITDLRLTPPLQKQNSKEKGKTNHSRLASVCDSDGGGGDAATFDSLDKGYRFRKRLLGDDADGGSLLGTFGDRRRVRLPLLREDASDFPVLNPRLHQKLLNLFSGDIYDGGWGGGGIDIRPRQPN